MLAVMASAHEIFRKRLSLSTTDSQQPELQVVLHALEYQNPYTLSMIFVASNSSAKIDISKEELATELKLWLNGKTIEFPSKVVSSRIHDSMMNFLKFGRPPPQTDIFLWMLSRSEVMTKRNKFSIYFGGVHNPISQNGDYSSTDIQALISPVPFDRSYQSSTFHSQPTTERPKSAPTQRTRSSSYHSSPYQTASLTQQFTSTEQVIGRSQAMEQLSTKSIKGRQDAKKTLVNLELTDDHYRLINHIQRRRKDLEQSLETRRRIIATGTARNDQTMQKYRQIHDNTSQSHRNNSWIREANEEVMTLDRIQMTLDEDIKRQRIQNQRNNEHIRWTMAPNGYEIYRGKSQKGYVIGSGPLPADATTSLRDPRLTSTIKQYAWDEHGRRHEKKTMTMNQNQNDPDTPISSTEEAMDIIRKASVNASLYKLNLKDLFHEMDTSGDGYLTIIELNSFFLSLGLQLDSTSLHNLFEHFDSNHSGSVHYSEFLWAFFNRRSFLKQFKNKTKLLTKQFIENLFYKFDQSGNGTLCQKEFEKLLKKLEIKLSRNDVEILMSRFDQDGDGELDLEEFYLYIDKEINSQLSSSSPALPLPPTVSPLSSQQKTTRSNAKMQNGKVKQRSKGHLRLSQNRSTSLFSDLPSPPPYTEEDEEEEFDNTERVIENDDNIIKLAGVQTLPVRSREGSVDKIQQLLHKQNEIEKRLGKKYYKTVR
jgi:Ca2+-binding EF-hand superfamily protein